MKICFYHSAEMLYYVNISALYQFVIKQNICCENVKIQVLR